MTWMVTDTLLRLLVSCHLRLEGKNKICTLNFIIQKTKSKKMKKNKNPKKQCLIHALSPKTWSMSRF